MKLVICLITYNRLDYTKRTLESLRRTLSLPHYLVVVDNASTDGTQAWLATQKEIDHIILNPINFYPGKACNQGWEAGLEAFPEATHLMRLDNDLTFFVGWEQRAARYFEKIKNLGQLGINYEKVRMCPEGSFIYKHYNGLSVTSPNVVVAQGLKLVVWPGNVGGPCILKRELWDQGLRYDETPWHDDGGLSSSHQEDSKLSGDVFKMGYAYASASTKIAETDWIKTIKDYPEYAARTLAERGYDRIADEMIASDPDKYEVKF